MQRMTDHAGYSVYQDAQYETDPDYEAEAEYEEHDEDSEQFRIPGRVLLTFNTEHYQKYDWIQDVNFRASVPKSPKSSKKRSFGIYDHFKLLTGPMPAGLQLEDTPHSGVRLDDRWAGLVSTLFEPIDLHSRWPAEFDKEGRMRPTRIPLGDPCLIFVKEGQKDIDGIPATETGCYYAWYRATALLCGAAGLDADLFRIVPRRNAKGWKGLGFRVGYVADYSPEEATFRVVSTAEGDIVQRILHGGSRGNEPSLNKVKTRHWSYSQTPPIFSKS